MKRLKIAGILLVVAGFLAACGENIYIDYTAIPTDNKGDLSKCFVVQKYNDRGTDRPIGTFCKK